MAVLFALMLCLQSASEDRPSLDRHVLFESGGALSWKIDGEYRIENGNLVLGGTRPIRFRVATLVGDYFLFRMDYRASIAGPPNPAEKGLYYADPQSGAMMLSASGSRAAPGVTIQFKNLLSSADSGMGLNDTEGADQWARAVFRGQRNPTTNNLEITGWLGSSTSRESEIMKTRPSFESMADARQFGPICINVPNGSQLVIRNAVLDGGMASDALGQVILWLLILVISVIIIATGGLILRRVNRVV